MSNDIQEIKDKKVKKVEVEANPQIVKYILGFNRRNLNELKKLYDIDVEIIEPELDGDPNLSMLKAVRSLVNDDRKRFASLLQAIQCCCKAGNKK